MNQSADKRDSNTADVPRAAFTGRVRRRQTKLSVKIGDIAARSLISLGGIGTIIAVSAVCLFLVWEALPLFQDAEIHDRSNYAMPGERAAADDQPVLHLATDDHQTIGYVVTRDGLVTAFRYDTGEPVAEDQLFEDRELTAWSFGGQEGDAVFGFADGSVQMGKLSFETQFLDAEDVPESLRDLEVNALAAHDGGVITRTPVGQFRMRRVAVDFRDPVTLEEPSPVLRLSHTQRGGRTVFVSYLKDGRLLLNELRERRNLMTGDVRTELSDRVLPFELPEGRGAPDHVLMAGLGDNIYVVWNDGYLLRYDLRDRENPRVVEAVDLAPEEGVDLTSVGFMVGRHSLVTGDSTGRVRVWFRVPVDKAAELEARGETEQAAEVEGPVVVRVVGDGMRLVNAHTLSTPTEGVPVTALGRSQGSRMLSIGYADGAVRVMHVTANELVLQAAVEGEQGVDGIYMSPRDDGVIALSGDTMQRVNFDPRHPSVTWATAFTPVWYEDYAEPRHMWQSSAGTDAFEPKYGLVPLVFGTLKATFYSMLFGLPLAMLAAIYTSEFLHRKVRARVKPVIEMMASLPSVVLGFVAALVIAPIVERVVPAMLLAFFTIPLAVLLGGYIWQMLPYGWQVRLTHWRIVFVAVTVLIAAVVTPMFGPLVEWAIFAGDLREWLRGERGSGVAGWAILLLPLCLLFTIAMFSYVVNPWVRERTMAVSRSRAAGVEFGKFALGTAFTVGLAVVAAVVMTYGVGDPRGDFQMWGMDLSPIDTYEQRNALIVGFVMGFAIIPIIYTIAEDALSAVPEHLRSASLGAGATPWQTAARLIVPTAMSGLFSAAMIGLGRAAGETMIVLMAAGNTPLMDMNIFNGFRTLSANIAVELPEAAIGGTHYRMLFLAALTLFAMTFAVNTLAEVVRLRFRKRAFQL